MEHFENHNNNNSDDYVKMDEKGMANDVVQLREIVHDLVGAIDILLGVNAVQYSLHPAVYQQIESLAISAHVLVCEEAAATLSKVLAHLVESGEIDALALEDEDETPITDEDRDTANRLIESVFNDI